MIVKTDGTDHVLMVKSPRHADGLHVMAEGREIRDGI